jgi:transposase-like protein
MSVLKPITEIVKPKGCKYCGSPNLVKIGIRHNIHGDAQRFLCKDCKHKSTEGEDHRVKATPKAITITLDLYYKGVSQRKIVEHLKMFEGVKVTQPCVRNWIRKYTPRAVRLKR